VEDADALVNFAVLLKPTNTSLRNDPPAEVLKRDEVSTVAVQGHRIPTDQLKTNDWSEFKKARAAILLEAIKESLGVDVAELGETAGSSPD
jgi:hypothetical protein